MTVNNGGRGWPPLNVGIIGFATMIELSLSALTKAWAATTIALGLLLAVLAVAQVWNSAIYLRALPQALELGGDGPIPVAGRNEGAGAIVGYAARAGQTGSW